MISQSNNDDYDGDVTMRGDIIDCETVRWMAVGDWGSVSLIPWRFFELELETSERCTGNTQKPYNGTSLLA